MDSDTGIGPMGHPSILSPNRRPAHTAWGEDGALLPEVSGTTDPPEDPSWARLWSWDLGLF